MSAAAALAPAPALALAPASAVLRHYEPAAYPTWLAGELTAENIDGPTMADCFVGDLEDAEKVFVLLDKHGNVDIAIAEELNTDDETHGLFSFGDLSFTNEDAAQFRLDKAHLVYLDTKIEETESRIFDIGLDNEYRATLFQLASADSSEDVSLDKEFDAAVAEQMRLGADVGYMKDYRTVVKERHMALRRRVRKAIVGAHMPSKYPMAVSKILIDKYE